MITYKDDFEATVMRWRAVARSNWIKEDVIKRFESFAIKEAERCYFKFKLAFESGGYGQEDVVNLSRIYLMNYLGNDSLMFNEDKAKKELEKVRDKTPEGLHKKDIANMHLSIRQRLTDAARLCTLKSQNFYGREFNKQYFKGPQEVSIEDDDFLKQYKRLGFVNITQKEYKKAKKASFNGDRTFIGIDGYCYKIITSLPLASHTAYDLEFTANPENEMINIDLESKIVDFENKKPQEKLKILNKFVKLNQHNSRFKTEVREAKKQIRALKKHAPTNS